MFITENFWNYFENLKKNWKILSIAENFENCYIKF